MDPYECHPWRHPSKRRFCALNARYRIMHHYKKMKQATLLPDLDIRVVAAHQDFEEAQRALYAVRRETSVYRHFGSCCTFEETYITADEHVGGTHDFNMKNMPYQLLDVADTSALYGDGTVKIKARLKEHGFIKQKLA